MNTNKAILSCLLALGTGVAVCAYSRYVKADEDKIQSGNTAMAAGETVKIDASVFPNEKVRQIVSRDFDRDKNGELSPEELDRVTAFYCANSSIDTLKGIEHFHNLKTLFCPNNALSRLDLSSNPLLESVDCATNRLVSLDLSNQPNLKSLDCGSNQIQALNLNGVTKLTSLSCNNNKLESLDVGNFPDLTNLSCSSNKISVLDVRNNTKLKYLSCGYNSISNLDLGGLTGLEQLSCSQNKLSSLDLRNNKELTYLSCGTNSLSTLNVNHLTKLTSLSCSHNNLESLNVSNLVKLVEFYCSNNSLTSIDFGRKPNLLILDSYNNYSLSWLDIGWCPWLLEASKTTPEVTRRTNYVRIYETKIDGKRVSLTVDDSTSFNTDIHCGMPMNSGFDRVLPDGDYIIATAASVDKNRLYFMDILGRDCPAPDGSNVSLWSGEEPGSWDIWTITYSDGFYTIRQKGTQMYLDVAGDIDKKEYLDVGANARVHTKNETTQKWAICYNSDTDRGYRVQAQCNGFSLDLTNGGLDNQTNIMTWPKNKGNGQTWLFIPYKPSQPVANGRYMILSGLGNDWKMDVYGNSGSVADGVNVQLYQNSGDNRYDAFDITKLDNGYYKIIHSASGKALTVDYGKSDLCQNICLANYDNALCQHWAIRKTGNGYTLIARNGGMVADVQGGVASNGANISQYMYTGNPNQIWTVVQAEYKVTYNANGGSGAPAAQTKYYKNALTLSSTRPTRAGCTFLGWATSSTATTATYQPGATYSTDKALTLYAVWKVNTVGVPSGVKAAVASATSVTVSWNAVTGASGYEVYRATSSNGTYSKLGEVTTTSRKCPGLKTGTAYYFKVRAFIELNGKKTYSQYSSVVSATPKLSAPASLRVTARTTTSVTIAWNAVTGAEGYEVYRATSANGTYSKLGEVTTTSRKCPGLTSGKKYFFKVRAYVVVDGAKKYSAYSSVVDAVTRIATPTVKIASSTSTSVTLSWNKITGATGYEVYRSTSANGTYSLCGSVTTTSRKCPGLSTGKTYYFKVRAYVEIGGVKYYGDYSSAISKTVK